MQGLTSIKKMTTTHWHQHQADKGITTVDMNKTDKIRHSQIQIDNEHNYGPVIEPMFGRNAQQGRVPN